MQATIFTIATYIEFCGSLIIVGFAVAAFCQVLKVCSPAKSKQLLTTGIIYALDFKLAATLLKTLLLNSWHSVGMFVVIYALRFVIKRSLVYG